MKRFKEGQQVVCTHPTGMWLGIFKGPGYGDIVTVKKYSSTFPNSIGLVEHQFSPRNDGRIACFPQTWFEPLMDINEITIELEINQQKS
ncbi:MAG TPA: hypothetical protein VL443_24545 [Cyclobacteriaceae bacterium]|jgi:hypothetical protein|nr:hypothetical protein [Cyclobacteriaceae bacterium]